MTATQDVSLADWLAGLVPELSPPVEVHRVGAGQSNVTCLVRDHDGREWILRRPPAGAHDRTAHDVHREARILRALAVSPVPVPTVVATGQDEAGVDGPFYVMERAQGEVLETEAEAEGLSRSDRLLISGHVAEVLVTLHSLTPLDVGLHALGRPDGYLERQIRRTERNWAMWDAAGAAAAEWAECRRRLTKRIPCQQRTSIAHGDFRLSNLLVEQGRVTAVLDWELCTLGDPLADLAWLVDDWKGPEDPAIVMPSPTRAGGFHHRDRLVDAYAAATGLDVSELPYYRAFTHWKAATLLQGVVFRRRGGALANHGSVDIADLESTIKFLLHEALELV
ncbi:phosphotransferase family protein [Amycolatopsis echigonensis]|uniref:Phosphotransferase family protein n=1 Tax=Amycolatopsis echigonensis TaxID=2576905 RepID=A0A8E1W893_9PSEU|nr:phosphotransferase family protein [Amycolatopsis echigonensis]MBB2505946.1 phosphotransferase family protein [Amycolatopsis echigonensis]